jgi:hypothetical protein
MPSDGKSSLYLWQGELIKKKCPFKRVTNLLCDATKCHASFVALKKNPLNYIGIMYPSLFL